MSTPELEPPKPKPLTDNENKEIDEILSEDSDPYSNEDGFDFEQDYGEGGDDPDKKDDDADEDLDEKETDDMLVAYEKEKEKRSKWRFNAIIGTMIFFATLLRWWDENDNGFLDSDFLLVEYFIFTAAMLYLMATLLLKPIFFWKGLVDSQEDRTVKAAAKPFEEGDDEAEDSVKKMNAALVARRRR